MVLALPPYLHAASVENARIASNALPHSTYSLRKQIEKISSEVSELDYKIAMEWDRRASLLHRINESGKPLPAIANLYDRLERQNKLERLLRRMEASKKSPSDKRPEVTSSDKPALKAEPVEPNRPPPVTEPKQSWKRAGPKTTAKKERHTHKLGKYYLFPFAGAYFPTNTSYKSQTVNGDLESKSGYTAGITGGRSFGNWTGDLSLSVNHHKFPSLRRPMPPPSSGHSTAGRGESYLVNLSARLGYAVPLSERSWLRFGGGLGLGYRAEGGVFYFGPTKVPLKTSKKAAFSYEAFAVLGYGLTERLRGSLGYRYLGAGEHGNFGTYGAHSVELGLGGNF